MKKNKTKDSLNILQTLSMMYASNRIYKLFILGAIFVHLLYTVLFSIIHIYPLAIYNIFSTILYILLYVFFKLKRLRVILIIINVELFTYVVMIIHYLGWAYNFHAYLYMIIPLSLLSSMDYKKKVYNLKIAFVQFVILLLALGILSFRTFDSQIISFKGWTSAVFDILNFFHMLLAIVVSFAILISLVTDMNLANAKLEKINSELSYVATHDPLTNLINRRSMNEQFTIAVEKFNEKNVPFTVILADIDDFKKVNDIYGHDSGDIVLKRIAKIIRDIVGDKGSVCRWGGEEILILYYNNLSNTIKVAEQIRSTVQSTSFIFNNTYIKATLTLGVSEYKADTPVNNVITQADANLYKGKKSTKNCVVT